jgi:putative ABC transport system ATP-binding protein
MIGFVFQSFQPAVADDRARERRDAADVPRRAGRASAIARARALERSRLADRSDHHSTQLSGGQQQRVAIARALVGEAPIIMADEPTGNLDSKTSYEVMAILQGLVDQGITVILVTHETDIAAYASRVVTLRDGLIIDDKQQTPVKAEVAA